MLDFVRKEVKISYPAKYDYFRLCGVDDILMYNTRKYFIVNLDFPIPDIELKQINGTFPIIMNPRFSRPNFAINDDEFYLDVRNVAQYQAIKGSKILYSLYENADKASVELFLQGSVFGAILHQQGILPFHGCSFDYKGKGILICGNSGAGKSSVTMAFCLNGARLINDDITPVRVSESQSLMIPMKSKIKLWDDSLEQLNINRQDLVRIRPQLKKYYIEADIVIKEERPIDHFFILYVHNKNEYVVQELDGMKKYNALRKQIYRRSYLKGMPEREKQYFMELFKLAPSCRVTVITRPDKSRIHDTMDKIKEEIQG